MKTKRHLAFSLIILLFGNPVFSAETQVFGDSAGWEGSFNMGLMETSGWKGMRALTLAPLGRSPSMHSEVSRNIDLLLLSEKGGIDKPFGNYRIEGFVDSSEQFPARGVESIHLASGGLLIYPMNGSMWEPGTEWGSFTLDFRLRPATLRDGEVFFHWEGRDEQGGSQRVVAWIERRRMVWEFKRFFQGGFSRALTFKLTSEPLIPGEWRHHQIRYNYQASETGSSGASPGLLEYLIDSTVSEMIHMTRDGHEGMDVYSPVVGSLSDKPLHIAPSFNGYLDEFRLMSGTAMQPLAGNTVNQINMARGAGRTKLIDTGYPSSTLDEIRARILTPGDSRVRVFVHTLNNREEIWTLGIPDSTEPDWVELSMTAELEDPFAKSRWYTWKSDNAFRGRYFAVGYIFEPDSTAGLAPVMSVLEVDYE